MKKRLGILALAIVCMLALAACGKKETYEAHYDEAAFKTTAETFLNNWFQADLQQLVDANGYQMSEEELGNFESSIKVKEQVGNFVSIKSTKLADEEEDVLATITVECEKSTLVFKVTLDFSGNVKNFGAERKLSLAETMENAGINTVLSMSIVFAVLIFISFIIYLLKFIPQMFEKKKQQQTAVTAAPAAEVPAVEYEEETEQEDESEIAAVIMAAIAAYEAENPETPADGLVVRTIRKRNPRMSY